MESSLRVARIVNLGLCLLGTLVFAGLLAYLQLNPKDFERRVQNVVVGQVEKHLKGKLSPASASRVEHLAGRLSERVAERVETLQAEIAAGVPRFVATVVAAMCRLDCTHRAALEAAILEAYQSHLGRLKIEVRRLRMMVEEEYHAHLTALRQDVGIFLSSNLIAIGLALALALVRGPASRHLLPFTALLTAATLFASWWYLYEQDWVTTVVYSKYFGWSYLTFLAAVFAFLVDIALNRARVTSEVLNAVGNVLHIPLSLAPC